MLWLSKDDVIKAGALNMQRAQKNVEEVFRLYQKGEAVNASEIPVIHPDFHGGRFYSLPAYVGGRYQAAGLKWTTLFPENSGKGLDTSCSLLILSEPESGRPMAVMEGSVLSSMRTGAVTATALKYLTDRRILRALCCGAGVQARQQIRAVCTMAEKPEQIYIWGRTRARAENLACELKAEFPEVEFWAVDHFREVIRTCALVIAATPAAVPYLKKEDFPGECLYCHIGMNEIETEAVNQFDAIICDDFRKGIATSRQSLFEAERAGTLNRDKLAGNLSEYITGSRSIRTEKKHRIMFDAFGLPVFDVVLGDAVFQYAREHGIGTEISL